jgi:hypothetical protein
MNRPRLHEIGALVFLVAVLALVCAVCNNAVSGMIVAAS